ncbi:hypothetical protein MRB53_038317 [Persea americana]|nr:hypothetical protein MRB53_038317 [Persea americana]
MKLSTRQRLSRSTILVDIAEARFGTPILHIKGAHHPNGRGECGEHLINRICVLRHKGGEVASERKGAKVGRREPIMMNVHAPSSTFICGSQGSGKSYTLNCMLENCLREDPLIGELPRPLAGLAFHFDSEASGSVAEVAYLCSRGIEVNVLVSNSNFEVAKQAYGAIPGAVDSLTVQPLLIHPASSALSGYTDSWPFGRRTARQQLQHFRTNTLRPLRDSPIRLREFLVAQQIPIQPSVVAGQHLAPFARGHSNPMLHRL